MQLNFNTNLKFWQMAIKTFWILTANLICVKPKLWISKKI